MSEIVKENKRYEKRIPRKMSELIVYAENIVKTTHENGISEERSLKIVVNIGALKDSLVSANSLQEKCKRDYNKKASEVKKMFEKLEDYLRELYRYLKYLYGHKSEEISMFGYKVGKVTIPDSNAELLALAGEIVANVKRNSITDEDILRLSGLIESKKDEVETGKASKSVMLRNQKDATTVVDDYIDNLYDAIRELIRYLEFKYGPKSEEFLKYGIKPLK